jgi:hypothetical protein
MYNQENLLYQLIEKSEKYLIPLGIWPSANNIWITLFNIIVLFSSSVLVICKNVLDPESESIENAIALGNGALCTVVYFVSMIVKKDALVEYLNFIKSHEKVFTNSDYKQLTSACAREYRIIMTALLCILPVGIAVRFLHPPLEYGYVKLLRNDKNFTLPPSMGIPTSMLGEIPTYILESIVRMIVLSTLVGICSIFILSSLYICTQYNILALELENITDDEEVVDKMIDRHQELLYFTKLLNKIFSHYFFADCFLSLINMAVMMFSFITHNIRLSNYIVEVPLLSIGIAQLFFVLYYGDRLIDAVSNSIFTAKYSLNKKIIKSEQIADAVYQSEWYTKPIKIKKKILLIIMMGQKPQTLNFGGNDVMVASMLLFSEVCSNIY